MSKVNVVKADCWYGIYIDGDLMLTSQGPPTGLEILELLSHRGFFEFEANKSDAEIVYDAGRFPPVIDMLNLEEMDESEIQT